MIPPWSLALVPSTCSNFNQFFFMLSCAVCLTMTWILFLVISPVLALLVVFLFETHLTVRSLGISLTEGRNYLLCWRRWPRSTSRIASRSKKKQRRDGKNKIVSISLAWIMLEHIPCRTNPPQILSFSMPWQQPSWRATHFLDRFRIGCLFLRQV